MNTKKSFRNYLTFSFHDIFMKKKTIWWHEIQFWKHSSHSGINSPNSIDRSLDTRQVLVPNKFPCRPVNVGFGLSNPIFLSSMSSRISPSSWQPDFVCQQNKTLIWIYWSQIHKTKDKKPNSKFFWLTFQLFYTLLKKGDKKTFLL